MRLDSLKPVDDPRMALLVAMYLEPAVEADLTAQAFDVGRTLNLSDAEIYELLERLADDRLIERDEPLKDGQGRIQHYSVSRLTQAGVEKALAQIRLQE